MKTDAPKIELVGHREDGTPFVLPAAPGDDPLRLEAQVRAENGRVSFMRLAQADRVRPEGTTAEEFARFNEMLAGAVQRGVPLYDGVRDLARDVKREAFRAALERVQQNLSRGASLIEAFEPERTGFPRLYGRLIEAGAAAGNLPSVLLMLSRNIRTDATFRRGVLETCIYPLLLLALCVLLLTGFATLLLPNYEQIARATDTSVGTLSYVMTLGTPGSRWTAGALLAAAALFAVVWTAWLRHRHAGRRLREETARRLPMLKPFYEAAVWSSAADTLALLMRARVPAPLALRLVGPATGTRWLARVCERLADGAEKGEPLSVIARRDPEVPIRVAHALDTGEIQQDMPGALAGLAERYRFESERRAQLLVRYLPPAFALAFGLIVFIIALAVLGPYISFWGAAW